MYTRKTPTPCFECGNHADHEHHVVPRSRGGTKTVPLCGQCHAKAHHKHGNMSKNALIRESVHKKLARGEWHYGRSRYGWLRDGDLAVKIDAEQQILTAVLGLYALIGTFEGVARRLQEHGISRRGKQWKGMQVRRAVLNLIRDVEGGVNR